MGDTKKNSFRGFYPEFGAIFMSNSETKEECFRRNVFALPSSQSQFVKQVKYGMILFLYEFESKKLHGVFRASSDGAMNILPHVFSSSGQQFPAQVKFTRIWDCNPLKENEFCDAIRENYYSKHKFNFGLSEVQVRRLLSLFDSRMKDQAPQRQFTGSKVARQSGYSTNKNRRLVDKSPVRNQVLGECGVDNQHRPNISTIHQGDSFYNDGRPTDDTRFGTYRDVGYEHKASDFLNECFRDLMGNVGGDIVSGDYATSDRMDNERNGIELQPAFPVYSSGNLRSISDDVRIAKSDRIETKCYEDDGFAPAISTAYPSSFQSKVSQLMYPSKRVLETDSFIDDSIRPCSAFCPSMEMQSSIDGYPMNFEDSLVTNSLPCDPDVPAMNHRGSSYLGFNQGHASLQEYASHDSFVRHAIGTSQNQSFPSLLETRNAAIISDVHSGSRDIISLPYSNSYEVPSRTSLQRSDYLDDLAAEYSKKESCGDHSLLTHSLAAVPSFEIRNNVGISEHSSSYRTSPSKFPCLTFSDRYPTLLQDGRDYLMPERESDAQFGNGDFMFRECQPHGESFYNDNRTIEDDRFAVYNKVEYENEDQQPVHVHEPINLDYHGVTNLSPAPSKNSDHRKRSSVFSRLALPSKTRKQESNISPGTADINRHTSVNEVMDMLHRSRNNWGKTRCKQFVKHNDAAASFRDKKQATRKDVSAMISKEMNVKSTSSRKENSCQKVGETSFTSSRKEKGSRKAEETTSVTSSRLESSSQKTGETTFVTSSRKENISQKTGETTFFDFKRRSAVRKNLEDGKTGGHCENLNDKSAPAAQSKKRKLVRPVFHENESSNRGIAGDAPQLVIVPSTECSVNKNAESIRISVVGVNEKDLSPNVMSQTAVKGNNIDKENGSNSKQLSVVNFIDSRSVDEGGKESSKSHCISSMTSSSRGDAHVDIEQDMTTSDIGIDGLSKDQYDVSHSTHESSPNICEDNNDGDGAAKSEFVYSVEKMNGSTPFGDEIPIRSSPKTIDSDGDGAAKSEFVCSIEKMNDLTTVGGEVNIISRGNEHVEIHQDTATNKDIGIDGLCKDLHHVSRSTHESSPIICEDNYGDGAAKREFVYSIEKMNDLTPVGGEIPISTLN